MGETHGTPIASIAYELEQPTEVACHKRIGKLIYYRNHAAQVRLDLIPLAAWESGVEWFIGNFVPTEKVPEPPFIDGDLVAATEDRGDPVFCGHIHTRQKEHSDETQYFLKLVGLPVMQWKRIMESDKEHRSIYLKVQLEE
jgi:hypothetical protein